LITFIDNAAIDMNKNIATASSSYSLPPGYVIHHAPDGASFAVPQFLLPATQAAIETEEIKNKMMGDNLGQVSSQTHPIKALL
jgi:hypothetical protein